MEITVEDFDLISTEKFPYKGHTKMKERIMVDGIEYSLYRGKYSRIQTSVYWIPKPEKFDFLKELEEEDPTSLRALLEVLNILPPNHSQDHTIGLLTYSYTFSFVGEEVLAVVGRECWIFGDMTSRPEFVRLLVQKVAWEHKDQDAGYLEQFRWNLKEWLWDEYPLYHLKEDELDRVIDQAKLLLPKKL